MISTHVQSTSCVEILNAMATSKSSENPPEEFTPFQRKLFRKVTKYPNHPLHAWVAAFADKISGHSSEVREAGISLAKQILKFRPESKIGQAVCDHLDKLVWTADFLDKSIVNDPLAVNRAASTLNSFSRAIEAIVTRYTLIDPRNLPEKLVINPDFIADPRIKFYNLLTAKSNLPLEPIDETIQLKMGFILADLRKQLFQKLIPQDEKDRVSQELYLEKKLQDNLGLIDRRGEVLVFDELKVNTCYKRMTAVVLMSLIVKGNDDTKFTYANAKSPRNLHVIPIKKKQGYENPEIVIDHVYTIMNQQRSLWADSLRQQFQAPSNQLSHYIDQQTGAITREGVKALLYSTQYLKAAD